MEITYIIAYAVGLVIGMSGIVYLSFLGLQWFLQRPFSYGSIVQWILFVIAMALVSGGVSALLPDHLRIIMDTILIHFGCIIAFHVFAYKLQEFLLLYAHYAMSSFVVHSIIVFAYVGFSLSAIFLMTSTSQVVIEVGYMSIEYIARTVTLLCLLFELKLRKDRLNQTHASPAVPHTTDYQNYDNQW